MTRFWKFLRIFLLILFLCSLLWLLLLLGMKGAASFRFSPSHNASLGIIGGADGPTAIYVTGSAPGILLNPLFPLILGSGSLLGFLFLKKRK